VASAILTPVTGWIGMFLSFGQGDQTSLTDLQNDLATLTGDVTSMQRQIDAQLVAIATQLQINAMAPGVHDVQVFQNSGNMPADTLWTIQIDREAVHDTMVGDVVTDGSAPGSGTGYLTGLVSPLRYICDTSPQATSLNNVFLYYQKVQAVLTQMMVEAAHQGQFSPIPSPMPANPFPGTSTGWPPPNYEQAQLAYATYVENIAEQQSFLPLPTTGISVGPYPTGIGANRIVFDRVGNITWGWQNLANPYSGFGSIGVGTGMTMQGLAGNLSASADRWKLRLPTGAELNTLYTTLKDSAGNAVTSATVVAAMTQVGFYVTLPPDGQPGFLPFATSEVQKASNWNLYGTPGTAQGYRCSWFYDLLNNIQGELIIYCPVNPSSYTNTGQSFNDPSSSIVNDGVFTDIQNATSVMWNSSLGGGPLPLNAYLDVLWVYQLANADAASGVTTDPPIEEPTTLNIRSVNQGNTTQFTASSMFNRFDRTAAAYQSVSLDIAAVYWWVDNTETATIDQTGLLTWKQPGSVTVTATRGPLSNSVSASSPSAFAPVPPTPLKLNIYPRHQVIGHTSLPMTTPFNGQILWSDGRTSTFGDADVVPMTHFPNGDAIPAFSFAVTASSPVTVDSASGTSVTIPAVTAGSFNVTVSLTGNPDLKDSATIRIT
jgi:hypothetical protein